MSQHGPETVGILADPYLNEWQVRAIERLQTELDVDVTLVVRNGERDREAESWNTRSRISLDDVREFINVFREEGAWAFVLAERNVAKLVGEERPLWRRHSLENVDCLTDAEHVECEPRRDGAWFEFPDSVVDRVADRCDLVILFGYGLIRGEILNAPEHGVLSFHPADIRAYRGMGPPPIFHDGQDRAGVTLQRLTESIDGGEIVAYDDATITDCYTLWDVFDRAAELQLGLLTEGVDNLRDPTFEPTTVPDEELGPIYYRKLRQRPAFSGRILAKNLTGRLRRRVGGSGSNETHDRFSTVSQ